MPKILHLLPNFGSSLLREKKNHNINVPIKMDPEHAKQIVLVIVWTLGKKFGGSSFLRSFRLDTRPRTTINTEARDSTFIPIKSPVLLIGY